MDFFLDLGFFRQRLQTSFGKAIELLEELGAFDDIAVMYQENPLSAELGFREDLFDMGRNMLGNEIHKTPTKFRQPQSSGTDS